MKIFRASENQFIAKPGYSANYVADIKFRQPIDTAGVILVEIPQGKTEPHVHLILEELFIATTEVKIIINEEEYQLKKGDAALVEPGEIHHFESPKGKTSFIIAIKFPNLSNDKN